MALSIGDTSPMVLEFNMIKKVSKSERGFG
jgi:hypothetical protein